MMNRKSAVTALPLAMTVAAGLIVVPLMVGAGGRKDGPTRQGADMLGFTADTSRLGSPAEGGIAGVSFSENFETGFTPGAGCGQNGWLGFCGAGVGFIIVENIPADPVFGSFSATHQSDGSGIAGVEIRSPELPAPETGRINADIVISDTASAYLLQSSPCTVAGCLINTRINFNPNGNIEVLQLTPGNCTTGVFTDSGADWAAGVTMRIGLEVDGAGVLRVYKDNVLIFTGADISVSCAPAGPQGISNIGIFAVNASGAATTLRLDNISSGGGGAPCPANIVTTGASATSVDIDDLLAVISAWGPCPAPPASCPANIATSGASATTVDIDDLLAVISAWGPCP